MITYSDTDREQFEIFKSLDRDVPINMLNLVQFFDKAEYPADHSLAGQDLTGAQAYAKYSETSSPVLARVGGKVIWRGGFDVALIGAPDETWDAMFIVHFPKAAAFLAMVTDPEYKESVIHRQAAVLNSRLVRTRPLPLSDVFG